MHMRGGASWGDPARLSSKNRTFLGESVEFDPNRPPGGIFGVAKMSMRATIQPMTDLSDEFVELHAHICKGLADPKRLLILNALRNGERSVTDLCEELDLPQANVSQHLAVLRERGLADTRRDGQRIFYSVSSPKIIEAMDLLREVMATRHALPATG